MTVYYGVTFLMIITFYLQWLYISRNLKRQRLSKNKNKEKLLLISFIFIISFLYRGIYDSIKYSQNKKITDKLYNSL